MKHTEEMMALIERELKPVMAERDSYARQLERARHSVEEWSRSCDYWRARVDKLTAALEKAKYPHMVCDDCWYSCPKSGECCNEEPKDKCTCGADIHNAAIDAVLRPDKDKEAIGAAFTDMALYGQGFTRATADGIKHIPYHDAIRNPTKGHK